MTADERIEKLLNRFGQTISDLPITYHPSHRYSAKQAAFKWVEKNKPELSENPFLAMAIISSYVCHLCDVIDRLEIALETALTQFGDDCDKCSTWEYCPGSCRDFFRLTDELLIDPELEIEIDDAD